MKATRSNAWKPVCATLFATAVALRALADQSAPASGSEKSYTGTVVSVDANEHVIRLKGWLAAHKAFNLGDNCVYSEPGKDNAPLNTMRPGEKVKVNYQASHGVLIADSIVQIPMTEEGMVASLDTTKHMVILHRTGFDKEIRLPDDCPIVLRDGKSGALGDIKVGSHVTVTYEIPDDTPTARQIAQTSLQFDGTLTAIDLENRTLKAKSMFTSKKFNVADDCAIVVNGKPDGQLSQLWPDENLVISYDEINGVNVVNRIARGESTSGHVATTGPTPQQ